VKEFERALSFSFRAWSFHSDPQSLDAVARRKQGFCSGGWPNMLLRVARCLARRSWIRWTNWTRCVFPRGCSHGPIEKNWCCNRQWSLGKLEWAFLRAHAWCRRIKRPWSARRH